jgi:hypothetical protein
LSRYESRLFSHDSEVIDQLDVLGGDYWHHILPSDDEASPKEKEVREGALETSGAPTGEGTKDSLQTEGGSDQLGETSSEGVGAAKPEDNSARLDEDISTGGE